MINNIARRDGPRIDVRLRVRYQAPAVQGEAEASDVSPRGLRLESEEKVPVGSELRLLVDAGAANPLEAVGHVMWCRPHLTPTQRTVYDVGVRFDAPWATPDQGPLGQALARVFSMADREVGEIWARTRGHLQQGGKALADLTLVDVSVDGLQLRAHTALPEAALTGGSAVQVSIRAEDEVHALQARVVWVVAQGSGARQDTRAQDVISLELLSLTPPQKSLMERIRLGQTAAEEITLSC